jgi:hypothetical protein
MQLILESGEESYCRRRLVQPTSNKLDSGTQAGFAITSDARCPRSKEVLQEGKLEATNPRIFTSGDNYRGSNRILQWPALQQGKEANIGRGDSCWRKGDWPIQVEVPTDPRGQDKWQERTLQEDEGHEKEGWFQKLIICWVSMLDSTSQDRHRLSVLRCLHFHDFYNKVLESGQRRSSSWHGTHLYLLGGMAACLQNFLVIGLTLLQHVG